MIIANVCSCLSCLVSVLMIVFFYIYAIDNPDRQAWYGFDLVTGNQKLFESENSASQESELIDIHSRFVAWFFWGFVMFITPLLAGALLLAAYIVSPIMGNCCSVIGIMAFGTSYLSWYITGIVWRFRKDGAFAAGDGLSDDELNKELNLLETTGTQTLYQLKSGKFMLIFYLITWCSCAVNCLGACVIALVHSCLKRDS